MTTTYISFKEIQKRFPKIRPSRLDYLVREGLVDCEQFGHGLPRLYPPEAISQIQKYLNRRQSVASAVDDDDNTQPSGGRELTARPKLPPSTGSPPPLSEDREIQ